MEKYELLYIHEKKTYTNAKQKPKFKEIKKQIKKHILVFTVT